MSRFEVKIVRIDSIEPIEGADMIELAKIAEYRSVIKKGQIIAGRLAVYIPEGAIVPAYLLERLGLVDKLAGSAKNRVKACKFRKSLSQGIIIPAGSHLLDLSKGTIQNENCDHFEVVEGQDVAEILGITKWEPPVPTNLAGEVFNLGSTYTIHYDLENLKWYPTVIAEGTPVVATEKLHGTNMQIGINLAQEEIHNELLDGDTFVASKGLGAKGLVFKWNEQNKNNVYQKAYHGLANDDGTVRERVLQYFTSEERKSIKWVYILAEVFGKGIQDLTYGLDKVECRAFDVYVGIPGQGRYLSYDEKKTFLDRLDIKMVPVIYEGPFNKDVLDNLVNGKNVEGKEGSHIREGLVITPQVEAEALGLGRVILKSISADYLLRKGAVTEFN